MTAFDRKRLLAIGCVLTWLVGTSAAAQDKRLNREAAPATEHRVALVIGNEAYAGNPLKNPVNDARAIGSALQQVGFDTDVAVNANFRDMSRAIDRFVAKLQKGDVALVYYSGHGIQIEGENYLLPVDFDAKDEADAKYVSYSASRLHDRISGAGVRLKILVLDACRNNPYRVSRSMSSGLAQMSASQGSFIGFATGPGSTADDNPSGSNGLFTTALIEALEEPGLNLEQVFYNVRQKVNQMSGGRQTPWSNSSVIGEFYFRSGTPATGAVGAPAKPPEPASPRPGGVPGTLSIPSLVGTAWSGSFTYVDGKGATLLWDRVDIALAESGGIVMFQSDITGSHRQNLTWTLIGNRVLMTVPTQKCGELTIQATVAEHAMKGTATYQKGWCFAELGRVISNKLRTFDFSAQQGPAAPKQ